MRKTPLTGDYAGLGRTAFRVYHRCNRAVHLDAITASFFSLVQGVKYFYYYTVQTCTNSSIDRSGHQEAAFVPIIASLGVLFIIVPWLYFAGFECSRGMATPGKTLLRIVVTDKEGNRISFARATLRHFAKFISTLIIFIGFIMIGFTKKRQGLHDKIAGCIVLLP